MSANEHTNVYVNGNLLTLSDPLFVENGRTYGPLRFISDQLRASVLWNDTNKTVTIRTQTGDTLVFYANSNKMKMNEKSYVMDVKTIMKNGRTYLPVRHVAEFLHSYIGWNEQNILTISDVPLHIVKENETLASLAAAYGVSVDLLKERNGLKNDAIRVGEALKIIIPFPYTYSEEWDLLARLIEAEAEAEAMTGKIAVGNVVMNRVKNSEFPNSIKEVIFQQNQFTPVKTGRIHTVEPSQSSIEAARRALTGEKPVQNALFFFNPALTNDTFLRQRQPVATIGNHRFVI